MKAFASFPPRSARQRSGSKGLRPLDPAVRAGPILNFKGAAFVKSSMDTESRNTEAPLLSPSAQFAVIEACLFAAGHPLTYSKLGEVLGVTADACADTVEKMASFYNNTDIPRGVMLVRFPDSCQLCTREEYSREIRQALGIRRGGNLSGSLLEVLAVIAYNQPVTRTFVDTVRGVDSAYAVNALLEKNLIEPCGRLDAPGRPSLYRTTTDFLRVFGLEALADLPAVKMKTETGENVEIVPGEPFLPADEPDGPAQDDESDGPTPDRASGKRPPDDEPAAAEEGESVPDTPADPAASD